MFKFSKFIFLIFTQTFLLSSVCFSTEQSPRALVHILDYLAQDYAGAVTQGKISSKSEFHEQEEFARRAIETNGTLKETAKYPEIQSELIKLQSLIHSLASDAEVALLSQKIKARVIEVTGLEVAPLKLPNTRHGAQLFAQACVVCHGVRGEGSGPAANGLNPAPANFHDSIRMNNLSPFKAFNAIRIGVPGTAMTPFPKLSDKEVWELAFYVMSLRYQGTKNEILKTSENISLRDLATLSDGQLESKSKNVAALRLQSDTEEYVNTLDVAREYLQNALTLYSKGDFDSAKNRALMAYLEGVEPIEPKLKSTDPSAMVKLEEQMALVRATIDGRKPEAQVLGSINSARAQLDIADLLINRVPASPSLTFTVAAAILLREGFEAVLIIIALLGVLRASGATKAARWIHGGWILALLLGVIAWVFSGWLIGISGAQRELMEGVTSVIAVLVLLYMGFWLHSKTESGRWRQFIDHRVKAALQTKNLISLAVISFTAVFREAFETVLFLRALWVEGGVASKTAMLSGVLSALALIFILSWALLRYSAHIPIKKLFDFSSTLMGILSVILIGKGIHSIQETGLLSITAMPFNLRIDLMGIYPTLETLGAQLLICAAVTTLWLYGKRPNRQSLPAHS
jgi:high-affinity iron transporter